MAHLPKNLPALLRQAGLTVVEIDNWHGHGRPGAFDPVGVNNHHIGASAKGWSLAKEKSYAHWMFRQGRSDLPAPLCQIALGRSGVVYVGASGRANHAGTAKAVGSVAAGDGNRLYIGIEWMLSGTEPIPAVMMEAGITLNAVLTEKVTKTSVRTIASHYQTSVTGKWDIGDPNGVPFKDKRVLDVDKFRSAVADTRERLYRPEVIPAPAKRHLDVLVGHFSGQFSDTPSKWRHDLDRVLARGYDWITGTEGDNRWGVIRKRARAHGYRVARHDSNWIAVKKSIIKAGSFSKGVQTLVPKEQVVGKSNDRGYLWVTFTHKVAGVGRISVIGSHYPPQGRPKAKNAASRVNLPWTRKMGKAVSAKAKALGKGNALTFFGADVNMLDQFNDVFFGGPLVTCWDELEKWPVTHPGAGNIDVIARYKGDKRVSCLGGRRFTDKQLFLYSDHFLIQARYRITLR